MSADGKIHGQSHSGVKLDIEWSPSHDHNDILTYAFVGHRAIVQNKRGHMWFYHCRMHTGDHHRKCDQFASYPGPVSEPIRKVSHEADVLFTWTCSHDNCFGIFVQKDGDVSTVNLGEGILDMFISEDHLIPNWIRVVAVLEDKVEIFRGPKYEPEGVVLWYTLDSSNAGEDWFCPTRAYHCPFGDDTLEVMNNCEGYNQKVLKYKIGDMTVDFINNTNLDSLVENPFFCPMGHEFIVGSVHSKHHHPVYSFGTSDDLNFWTIPKTLLGDQFWNYTCLSHMSRFVTYGFDKDGRVTATTIVGNRGSEQLRRYSNVVTGLEATRGVAYEGMDNSIIHWFTTTEGPIFYETYDKPILELDSPAVEKETEFEVTFTFHNQGEGKATMKKKVTVVP